MKFKFGYFFSILIHLIIFIGMTQCGQDYNSNSGDKPVSNKNSDQSCSTGSESDKRRCQANLVLSQSCFSCHTSWSKLSSDQAFIDEGLIKKGDSSNSSLMKSLINNGGKMPKGGSALNNNDVKTLENWIKQL